MTDYTLDSINRKSIQTLSDSDRKYAVSFRKAGRKEKDKQKNDSFVIHNRRLMIVNDKKKKNMRSLQLSEGNSG